MEREGSDAWLRSVRGWIVCGKSQPPLLRVPRRISYNLQYRPDSQEQWSGRDSQQGMRGLPHFYWGKTPRRCRPLLRHIETRQARLKSNIHILMLEDDVTDAELIQHALQNTGMLFTLARVCSKADFLRELSERPPDLILLDYSLPGFDGLTALHIAQEKHPDIPFIFVTGTLGEEVVIEMLKSGATDYVLKNRLTRLGSAVQRALREARNRVERRRAEENLRKSHKQLRALSVYLQYVREDERIRISRQVHDELGQALTGLKMDLYWLASRLPRKLKGVHAKTQAMSDHIDTTIQTVRRISTELRPGILDSLGLAAALEWQAQEFQKRTGIPCPGAGTVADSQRPQVTTVFFRIYQEALTNIIRHAKATRVDVRLAGEDGALVLTVKDNGRG